MSSLLRLEDEVKHFEIELDENGKGIFEELPSGSKIKIKVYNSELSYLDNSDSPELEKDIDITEDYQTETITSNSGESNPEDSDSQTDEPFAPEELKHSNSSIIHISYPVPVFS